MERAGGPAVDETALVLNSQGRDAEVLPIAQEIRATIEHAEWISEPAKTHVRNAVHWMETGEPAEGDQLARGVLALADRVGRRDRDAETREALRSIESTSVH